MRHCDARGLDLSALGERDLIVFDPRLHGCAEALDIKPKTVYARLSRAKEALRGALEADSRRALLQRSSGEVMP